MLRREATIGERIREKDSSCTVAMIAENRSSGKCVCEMCCNCDRVRETSGEMFLFYSICCFYLEDNIVSVDEDHLQCNSAS